MLDKVGKSISSERVSESENNNAELRNSDLGNLSATVAPNAGQAFAPFQVAQTGVQLPPASGTGQVIKLKPNAAGVVTLPDGSKVVQLESSAGDLRIVLEDGRVFVVEGGATNPPSVQIGTQIYPPQNLVATFGAIEEVQPAGPAPSSGENFSPLIVNIDPAYPILPLLPPTAFGFPQFEQRELGFNDDAPTVGEQSLVELDEDFVNSVHGTGNQDADGTQGDNDGSFTYSGNLVYGFGANGPNAVEPILFHASMLNGQGLQSHGVDVVFTWDQATLTLTGTAGDHLVIQLIVTDFMSGVFTITIYGPLDHQPPGTGAFENDILLNLPFTVKDGNGTPQNGILPVRVDDDAPWANGEDVSVRADEDDILTLWSQGTSPNDGNADGSYTEGVFGPAIVTSTGSLSSVVSFGADGPAPATFSFVENAAEVMASAYTLFSKQTASPENGKVLTYQVAGNVLTAYEPAPNGNPVFSLTLEPNGDFTFRLFDELIHQEGNGENSTLRNGDGFVEFIDFGQIIKATDFDGDSVVLTGKVRVYVTDDVPEAKIIAIPHIHLVHDETAGILNTITQLDEAFYALLPGNAQTSFDGIANKGDDPHVAGTGAIGYARSLLPVVLDVSNIGADFPPYPHKFSLSIEGGTGALSNLTLTDGTAIYLVQDLSNPALVIGRAGSVDGPAAFAIHIDDFGSLSLVQYLSLNHPIGGSSHDEPVDLDGFINAVVTVTDSDGDSDSDSVAIGGKIVFEDDGPTLLAHIKLFGDVLHDETPGNQGGFLQPDDDTNPTPAILGIFSSVNGGDDPHVAGTGPIGYASSGSLVNVLIANFGSDGPGATNNGIQYTFTIGDSNYSGLQTTEGQDIFLFDAGNNVIVGRYDADSNGIDANDPAAFAIHVNPDNGELWVAQYMSLRHPNTSSHDETVDLNDGALSVTVTLTDGDGDTVSQDIDISGRVRFDDDGPKVDVTAPVNKPNIAALNLDETRDQDYPPNFTDGDDRYNGGEPQDNNGDLDDTGTGFPIVPSTAPAASAAIGSLTTAINGGLNSLFNTVINYGADGPSNNDNEYGSEVDALTLTLSGNAKTNLVVTALDGTPLEGMTIQQRQISLVVESPTTIIGVINGGPGTGNDYVAFRITILNPGDPVNAQIKVDQFLAIDHDATGNNGAGTQNAAENPSLFDESKILSMIGTGTVRLVLTTTVTDGDGDTDTDSANVILINNDGSFIQFDDDGPVIGQGNRDWTLDEDVLAPLAPEPVGNDALDVPSDSNDYTTITLGSTNLGIDWGTDGVRQLTFNGAPTITDGNGNPLVGLTSGGVALQYQFATNPDGGQTLTAFKGAPAGGIVVFTITLDPDSSANGQFTFTLSNELDHPLGQGQNSLNLTFPFTAKDGDFDAATSTIVIRVTDDVPYILSNNYSANADFLGGNWGPVQWWGQLATSLDNWTIQPSTVEPAGTLQIERTPNGYLGMVNPFGDYMIDMAASPGNIQISQQVSGLTSGQPYAISFVAGAPFPDTAAMEVWFGGNLVGTIQPTGTMTPYSFIVTASGVPANDVLMFREVGTGNDPLPSPNVNEGYHGTYLGSVKVLLVNYVDEDGLPEGIGNSSTGDNVVPNVDGDNNEATTIGNLNIAWGSDNSDIADAGGVQDGALAASLTGRSVYFTNNIVTVGGVSLVSGVPVLKSHGDTVSFVLSENGTKLLGVANDGSGQRTVFEVSLSDDGTGQYTFKLLDQLDHAPGADENDITLIFNFSARDFDGDVATGSFVIGVDDDLPVGTFRVEEGASVTVDESLGANAGENETGSLGSVTADAATLFTNSIDFGADGPAANNSIVYALSIVGENGLPTGLVDTATGLGIVFFDNNGVIEGHVGVVGGPLSFSISVAADGDITLTQFRAVVHDDTNDHDESASPAGFNAETLTLTQTLTDYDLDPISNTVNISSLFRFEDDGPVIGQGNRDWTIDEDVLTPLAPEPQGNDALDVPADSNDYTTITLNGTNLGINWGSDGIETLTFNSAAPSVTDGNGSPLGWLTSGGVALQYVLAGNPDGGETLTAYKGAPLGGIVVFSITLDPDFSANGAFTFTISNELDHPAGQGQNTLNLTFPFTATDGDNDTATSNIVIRVTDDVPYILDGAYNPNNLIQNGSFEQGHGLTSGNWSTFFSIPGWVSGDGVTPFEIQVGNVGGLLPQQGNAKVELDSHNAVVTNATIQQTIATTAGETYELTFWYSPRPGDGNPDSSSMRVIFGGSPVMTLDSTNIPDGWQQYTVLVTATGPSTVLAFQGFGQQNTLGAYLDNVSLLPVSMVDEDDLNTALSNGNNDVATGDNVPPNSLPQVTRALNVAWGSDNSDTADAGGLQDGAATNASGDNSVLTGRALYFTNPNVVISGVGVLTSHGDAVQFSLADNGTRLVATANDGTGPRVVFDVTLSDDGTGSFTFKLYDQLDHAPANFENDLFLKFNFTARDFDGDTANGTFTVGVDDDLPVAAFALRSEPASVTVDESLGQNAGENETTSLGSVTVAATSLFVSTIDFGADEPEAGTGVGYSVVINGGNGTPSGLVDTLTGQSILLVQTGLTIEGRTETGNQLSFSITVGAGGNVTLTQYRAVVHNDPNDHDEAGASAAVLNGNLILLTQTVTDYDLDPATNTIDISSIFRFEDDGPTLSLAPTNNILNGLFFDGFTPNGNAWATGSGTASGTAGGWTITGDGPGTVELQRVGDGYLGMHSSTSGFMVDMDATPGNVAISQTVAGLQNGQSYTLTFEAGSPDPVSAALEVWFGGQLIFSIPTPSGVGNLTPYALNIVGGSGNGTNLLEFREVGATENNHGTYLANVSVNDFIIIDETPGVDADADDNPTLAGVFAPFMGAILAGNDPDMEHQFAAGTGAIVQTTVNFGSDGPNTSVNPLTYALNVTNAGSGLQTTEGKAIQLFELGNQLVVGRYDSDGDNDIDANDNAAVAFYIDPTTGVLTAAQFVSLKHPITGASHDEGVSLNGGTLEVRVTATDGDFDTLTQTSDISGKVLFQDDGPSIFAYGSAPSLVVDETDLLGDASASFASIFIASFGSDGASASGGIAYTLGVNAGSTGLFDTLTGQAVVLSLESGQVFGKTAIGGDTVFIISVDGAGTVTLNQLRAIAHDVDGPDPVIDHDDAKSLQGSNLITLTATVTDGDGDTAVATADISNAFTFKDDGPSVLSVDAKICGQLQQYGFGENGGGNATALAQNGAGDRDILITAIGSNNNTVNGDSDDLGAGNQSTAPGELLRIDFVKTAQVFGSGPGATYSNGVHYGVDSASFNIAQIQGNPANTATVFVQVFSANDDQNYANDGSPLAITLADVTVANDATFTKTAVYSGGVIIGVVISGLDDGARVTVNTVAEFNRLNIENYNGVTFTSDTNGTQTTLSGGSDFTIGGISSTLCLPVTLRTTHDESAGFTPQSGPNPENDVDPSTAPVGLTTAISGAGINLATGVLGYAMSQDSYSAATLFSNPDFGADGPAAVNPVQYLLTTAGGAGFTGLDSGLNATVGGFDIRLYTDGTNPAIVWGVADNGNGANGPKVFALYIDPATGQLWVAQFGAIAHDSDGSTAAQHDDVASIIANALFVSVVVTDGDGDTAYGISTNGIEVNFQDSGPIAVNDVVLTDEDQPITFSVTGNDNYGTDGAALAGAVVKLTNPSFGSVVLNPDNTFTYTPNANYNGPDSFTYRIYDGDGDFTTATVNLTVRSVPDAPTAINDLANTKESGVAPPLPDYFGLLNSPVAGTPSASGNILSNDTDPDGAVVPGTTHSVVAVGYGSVGTTFTGVYGEITINANGSWTYNLLNLDPETQALVESAGVSESFTYTMQDGTGLQSTATLQINVAGTNDAPAITHVIVGAHTTGNPPTAIMPDLAITDVDSPMLNGARVVLTDAESGDLLSYSGTLPAGVNVSLDLSVAGQITLTFLGAATLADYQALLQTVNFGTTSVFSSTSPRNFTFQVIDDNNAVSNIETAQMTVELGVQPLVLNVDGFTRTVEEEHLNPSLGTINGETVTAVGNEDAAFSPNDLDTPDDFNVTTHQVTGSFASLVVSGLDGTPTFGFAAGINGTQAIFGGNPMTSAGQPVVYVVAGNTLYGYVEVAGTGFDVTEDRAVFALTVDPATGAYTFSLLDKVDHTFGDQIEGTQALNLSGIVTITDSAEPETQGFPNVSINIIDDVPVNLSQTTGLSLDEDDLIDGNDLDKELLTAVGALDIDLGADGGSITLAATNATWNANTQTLSDNGGVWQVALNANGTYTFTLLDNSLAHPFGDNTEEDLTINVTFSAVDGDGDALNGNFDINIIDDVPVIVASNAGSPSIVLDETYASLGPVAGGDNADDDDTLGSNPFGRATISGAAIVGLFSASAGADGLLASSFALVLRNSAGTEIVNNSGTPVATNLSITGGGVISLYHQGGEIVGRTVDANGPIALKATINAATGEITVEQYLPIQHILGGANHDDSLTLDLLGTGGVFVSRTITDGDGDIASAVSNVPVTISIEDDGPSATLVAGDDSAIVLTTQDAETISSASDTATANFSAIFSSTLNFGTDGSGPVFTGYAFTVASVGVNSGLQSDGQPIYLYLTLSNVVHGSTSTTLAGVNSSNIIFTISVSGAGSVLLTQNAEIDHPTGGGTTGQFQTLANNLVQLRAGVTITDGDGDTSTATASIDLGGNIRFEDHGPTITANGAVPTLVVDESNFANNASTSFASVFTPVFGADGPGTVGYTLSIDTSVPTGLVYTATGQAIVLVQDSATQVTGRIGNAGGIVAFTVTVNGSGVVSLDQERAVAHDQDGPLAADHDDPKTLALANQIKLVATITDGDGDTNTATANIGTSLVFEDDGPSVTLSGVQPAVMVDESFLATNASVDLSFMFTRNFGADGGSTVSYALGVNSGSTGLFDTQTGLEVVLTLASGVVTGSAGSGGPVVFTLSVLSNGVVQLDQQRAVVHSNTSNHDDSTTLSSANLITLTSTITDGDGDTASQTANIATQLTFKDDGVDAKNDTDSFGNAAIGTTIAGNVITGLNTNEGTGGTGTDVTGVENGVVNFIQSNNLGGLPVGVIAGGTIIGGQFGGLQIFQDGSYIYTRTSASAGVDTFTYRLTDKDGDNDTATLTINLLAANGLPTVNAASVVADEDNLTTAAGALFNGNNNTDSPGDNAQTGLTGSLGSYGTDGPTSSWPTSFLGIHTQNVIDLNTGNPVQSDGITLRYYWDTSTSTLYGSTDLSTQLAAINSAVFKVQITQSTAAYQFTLIKHVDHPAGNNENDIDINIGYTLTDANGDAVPGTLSIKIDDDMAVSTGETFDVLEGTKPSVNVVLVIDTSGSMDNDGDPGPGTTSRMDLAKQAALNLLNTSSATINQVMVVDFDNNTIVYNPGSGVWQNWSTNSAGITGFINGMSASDGTNFDLATQAVRDNWGAGPTPATQTLLYFLSDGNPEPADGALTGGEITVWENFLVGKVDASYGIGIGGSISLTNLEPIAWAPGNAAFPPIQILNATELGVVLSGSLPGEPSGNILSNDSFGADGGYIRSITIDGVTFTYNGSATITADGALGAGDSINANGKQITIVTNAGGTMIFNFGANGLHLAGDWDYRAPTNVPSNTPESFAYTLIDGDGDTTGSTLLINVLNINQAPVGVNSAVSTNEDIDKVFAVSDFQFTDVDGNGLSAVIISTLPAPASGILTLNGVAVTAGQSIPVADITAGLLKFEPALNFNGAPTFTFRVVDNGGTANGGVNTDGTPNTMTITVTPVNDAPTANITNLTFAATEQTDLYLAGETGTSNGDGASLGSIADLDSTGNFTLTLSVTSGILTVTAGNSDVDSITNSGTSTVTVTGTMAAINDLLGGIDTGSGNEGNIIYNANTNNPPATATLTMTVTDSGALVGTDTATINITGVNDIPVVLSNAFSATENAIQSATAASPLLLGNVLSGDFDPEGATLTVSATTTPTITESDAQLSVTSITALTAGVGETSRYQIVTNTGTAVFAILTNGGTQIWTTAGDPFGGLSNGESATINFGYTAFDGTAGGTASTTAAVTVNGNNDALTSVSFVGNANLTASGGASTSLPNNAVLATLSSNDPDSNITYTFGDNASSKTVTVGSTSETFEINSAGVMDTTSLSYNAVHNFIGIGIGATNGTETVTGGLTFRLGTETAGDTINGSASNVDNLIYGFGGNDTITGGTANDWISGGTGNDTINGNGGNDTLIGGPGVDTITGGTGADTFVLTDLSTADIIVDYNLADGDLIDLTSLFTVPNGQTAFGNGYADIQGNQLMVDVTGGGNSWQVAATFSNSPTSVNILYDHAVLPNQTQTIT